MKLYKKILVILICIILIGIVFFISKNIFQNNISSNVHLIENTVANNETNQVKEKLKNVSMYIKENTLTKTNATIVIKDNNEEPLWYGKWFRIDKYNNGDWEMLPINEEYYVFFDLAYGVNKDGILEMKTSWEMIYGELEQGKYRIVKRVGNQEFYTEFIMK